MLPVQTARREQRVAAQNSLRENKIKRRTPKSAPFNSSKQPFKRIG